MEFTQKSWIKKTVVAIVVALLVGAAGYFGLDVKTNDVTSVVTGIADVVSPTEPDAN